jgi:hypothetical protein
MNSPCHFFFNHLGMLTQLFSTNSSVSVIRDSVLHGTNLHSTNLNLFPQRKHFHRTVARRLCWNVFTESPPNNVLSKSITVCIEHLQIVTICNHSAIANSHSTAHILVFSVCCIFTGCLVMASNNVLCFRVHVLTGWSLSHNCRLSTQLESTPLTQLKSVDRVI